MRKLQTLLKVRRAQLWVKQPLQMAWLSWHCPCKHTFARPCWLAGPCSCTVVELIAAARPHTLRADNYLEAHTLAEGMNATRPQVVCTSWTSMCLLLLLLSAWGVCTQACLKLQLLHSCEQQCMHSASAATSVNDAGHRTAWSWSGTSGLQLTGWPPSSWLSPHPWGRSTPVSWAQG